MRKIPLFLTFYRSFYCYPTLILTLCACFLYYQNSKYGITFSLVMLKVITTGLIAYAGHSSKELYYYYNLGLGFRALTIYACTVDILSFAIAIQCTKLLIP